MCHRGWCWNYLLKSSMDSDFGWGGRQRTATRPVWQVYGQTRVFGSGVCISMQTYQLLGQVAGHEQERHHDDRQFADRRPDEDVGQGLGVGERGGPNSEPVRFGTAA